MTWQTFVFIPLASFVFGYSFYRFFILYKLMLAHQNIGPSLDQIKARIWTAVTNVLGQKAVLRKKSAGIMHAIIFWGFIIISLGTLEQFVTTIYQTANFEFIGDKAYLVLVFLQDIFTFGVLLAVLYAAYRRYIVRPEALGKSKDATIILSFIALLMAAILLTNGFTILAHTPWFQGAMPVASYISSLLSNLGLSPEMNMDCSVFFKWAHMLIVLGFAVYIPRSKHLHIVAAAPNTFLRTLGRSKPMQSINFENEKITQYGAAKISDLSWKDALDYYSCTECGRCQEVCPAWNTGKPLSPKLLILDLKENLYRNKEKILAKKYNEVSPVIDANVTENVIWACTTCRACEIACPVFVEQTNKIYDIRRNLVLMESKFPTEVQTVFKNMETNATPWAFSSQDRAKWAEGLNIKTMAEDSNVDFLLWVG
ncbi:MAG: (Fe-S)-binding protein, partial [Deltaproteobacteria bacterium]|nr:(Fe-S)-binding protein [Deltaproteobacteria bacterium]